MAENGVAALSHAPSGERVRTGPADPSGAWDQDHPPSTATTTQESGLRGNRTSRLRERAEERRKPDRLRLYTDDGGEPSSSGPVRGKGGARSREPLPRHTGGDPEPCKPVHEPTTDSRSGEGKTGGGAQLAAPRHRSGLDGGLSADPQGWCPWHRRRDGGGLRSGPRGQSVGPPGSHSLGSLSRTAGAPGLHPESGRLATAARHPDLRRQG